jgi:hypothetical protein
LASIAKAKELLSIIRNSPYSKGWKKR